MPEPAGEIPIIVTGDFSDLSDAVREAESVAQDAGQRIAQAFEDAATTTGTFEERIGALVNSGHTLSEAMAEVARQDAAAAEATTEAGGAADSAGSAFTTLRDVCQALGIQLTDTTNQEQHFSEATQQAGHSAGDAESGLKGMAEQLAHLAEALVVTEGLKELGEEALKAFDSVQRASNSLTALTGSAESAKEIIEELEGIAKTQPFAFPELAQSAQKLAAFGIEAEKIPELLQSAALASRATGNSFETISNALGRVELTGQVAGRQLVQLGLSWKDLAKVMGTSITEAQERLKKGGQDAAKDVDVLLQALQQKFGAFAEVPLSISEQWKVMQNNMHAAFAELGVALAPIIRQVVDFLTKDLIPAIKGALDAFNSLPEPVRNGAVAMGVMVASLAPLAAAISGAGLAVNALKSAVPPLITMLEALGVRAGAVATQAEAAAVATTHLNVAASGGAAGGLTAIGAAAGGAALLLGTLGGAVVVTAANLRSLSDEWDRYRSVQVNAALAAGHSIEDIKKTGTTIDQIKQSLIGVDAELDYSKIKLDTWGNAILANGLKASEALKFVDDIGPKIQIITDKGVELSAGLLKLIQAQTDANTKLKEARENLATLSTAYSTHTPLLNGHVVTLQEVNRARADLTAAEKAAEVVERDSIKTVSDLASEEKTLGAAAERAQLVFVEAAHQFGISSDVAQRALDQMRKANQAAFGDIEPLGKFEQALKDVTDAQEQAEETATNLGAVYLTLKAQSDGTESSTNLLTRAWNNFSNAANAAGTSTDKVLATLKSYTAEIPILVGGIQQAADAGAKITQVMVNTNSAASQLLSNLPPIAQDVINIANEWLRLNGVVAGTTSSVQGQSYQVEVLSGHVKGVQQSWDMVDASIRQAGSAVDAFIAKTTTAAQELKELQAGNLAAAIASVGAGMFGQPDVFGNAPLGSTAPGFPSYHLGEVESMTYAGPGAGYLIDANGRVTSGGAWAIIMKQNNPHVMTGGGKFASGSGSVFSPEGRAPGAPTGTVTSGSQLNALPDMMGQVIRLLSDGGTWSQDDIDHITKSVIATGENTENLPEVVQSAERLVSGIGAVADAITSGDTQQHQDVERLISGIGAVQQDTSGILEQQKQMVDDLNQQIAAANKTQEEQLAKIQRQPGVAYLSQAPIPMIPAPVLPSGYSMSGYATATMGGSVQINVKADTSDEKRIADAIARYVMDRGFWR